MRPLTATPPITGQDPAAGRAPLARRHRGVTAGVAGALLAFLVVCSIQALGLSPYMPPDELYHVGYAVVVRDGHLPTLTTPVPADEVPLMPQDGRPRRIYTANHPPLFYLPVSVLLRIDRPRVALVAGRMLSAGFGAVGVLLVAWLALILVPSRPRVAVVAAWFAALLPAMPHDSAVIYNDALGFLASTAALVAAALALRRGPTGWRLAGLAAAAAAAALTRAPGLALVAVAGVAAAVAVWLHSQQPAGWRLLRAAGAGALVGGFGLAASLWFYLRNRALYGDLTGAHFNSELFGFHNQENTAVSLATSPGYMLKLFDGLWVWTRFATRQIPVERTLVLIPRVIALAVLAGLAIAAARGLRNLRARRAEAADLAARTTASAGAEPEPATGAGLSAGAGAGPMAGAGPVADPSAGTGAGAGADAERPAATGDRSALRAGELATWLLMVGWLAMGYLMVAWYDGTGGRIHARYLLPAIAVLAIGAAVGLDALPGARRGLTSVAVSIPMLVMTWFAWTRHVASLIPRKATPRPTAIALADFLHRNGVPYPWLLMTGALLVLLAGFALQQGGMWLLARDQPRDQAALPPADALPEPVAHQ